MKYIAYRGTRYQYTTAIPERKKFSGKWYHLADVFPNYGQYHGHKTAKNLANQMRARGNLARTDAHSGFTAVYIR